MTAAEDKSEKIAKTAKPSQYSELLADLDYLWRKLVLRSNRVQHQGIYDRLRRHFVQLQEHAERNAEEQTEEEDDDDDEDDEPPFAIARRVMLRLTPEQRKQLDVMLLLHELSEIGRVEVFDEQQQSHCIDCGVEIEDDEAAEAHVAVCRARGEGEDEDGEDEDNDTSDEPETETPDEA